jgi:hypothetical protein
MFGILLAAVIAFALVAAFIAFYIRRVADLAITDQFRAAELICDGKFPGKWYDQINQRLARDRLLPDFIIKTSGTELALMKIDRLKRFFEKSPFFENAEARELLLEKLRDAREHWLYMSWEDISKEHFGEFPSNEEKAKV